MSYRGRINDFPMEPPKPDMLMWELRVKQLEARVAELEAREAILEGVLRSVQDCIVRADGLPHALRLITEALVNRRAQG